MRRLIDADILFDAMEETECVGIFDEQPLDGKEQTMKRKYIRKCGYCGKRFEQKDMVRTDLVRNGWLCKECYESEEPLFDVDEVELGTEQF